MDAKGERQTHRSVLRASKGRGVRSDQPTQDLRARLPEYMVPQHLLPLEEIPLTPNGKVDRRRLPAPVVVESGIGRHEAPSDPVEATIAEIWTQADTSRSPVRPQGQVLRDGRTLVARHRAVRQIEQKLGVKLDLRVLSMKAWRTSQRDAV